MELTSRIYVAGHTGLVGSGLCRALRAAGYRELIMATSGECDLRDQHAVRRLFAETKPEYVFMAAAKVGGIIANATYPADFIYDNLAIATNVLEAAYRFGVKRLLFLGSSCIYPKHAPQPITESALLSGPLEETNAPYAIAKIAGIGLAQAYVKQYGCNFISAMPTNLYGPGDTFDTHNSHVIPAIITKVYRAKKNGDSVVVLGGTGSPLREFMFIDDCVQALLLIMHQYELKGIVNVGSGQEISIAALAHLIKDLIGFAGAIVWDHTVPDGTPRKLLNIDIITRYGFIPKIALAEGLRITIDSYIKHIDHVPPVLSNQNQSECAIR